MLKLIAIVALLISISHSKDNLKTLEEASKELKIQQVYDVDKGMPLYEGNYLEYSYKMHEYINKANDQYPGHKLPGVKQFLRNDYFMQSRISDGEYKPDYEKAFEDYYKLKNKTKDTPEFQAENTWSFIGPAVRPVTRSNQESDRGTGRINVLRVAPNNSSILWVGAAGGGVWKSTNKGQTWKSFDITGFASLGISDIAISKSNSNVVYAATGDKNTGGNGSGGLYSFFTIGILKTTDGGNNWSKTNFLQGIAPANGMVIYKILVHPSDQNKLYVSTTSGLFTSEDGGNTWTTLDNTRGYGDMEFNPSNPELIYCVRIDSYASKTIRTYSTSNSNFISEKSYTSASRAEIAVTPNSPDNVYCLMAHTGNYFRSLEKSTNRGGSWTTVKSINDGINYLGFANGTGQDLQLGQGWYDLSLAVNPKNANEIYIGGVNIWKSVSAGSQFNIATYWQKIQEIPFVHADQHYFTYDDNGTFYSCNDGGVRYTTNGGTSWVDISNGLEVTQFYRFGQSMQNPNLLIGGAQDNSTFVLDNGTWYAALGGDGFHCTVDPKNDQYVYGSNNVGGSGGLISMSSNGGVSFSAIFGPGQFGSGENAFWVTPFELDPNNPQYLYAGYENIWVSDNRGVGSSWSKLTNITSGSVIRYIAVSPHNNNKLYCSIGQTLLEVNKTNGQYKVIYTGPSSSTPINSIFVDILQQDVVYVTLGGFSGTNKVIKITNGQASNITYNLPNLSCNALIQQPITGDYYVGMDAGVYKMSKNGNSWSLFDKGLPTTVISELEIQKSTGKLRAATHGRGIWEVELLDCQLAAPTVSASDDLELCEGENVVLTLQGNYTNFEWSTGAKTKSITVSQAGKYYVTIYDSKGCFAQSNEFEVKVSPKVDVVIKVPNDKFVYCKGEKVRLIIPLTIGSGTYLWSNGETTRNVDITESGDYWVDYTKIGTNCTYRSEKVTLSFRDAPSKPSIERQTDKLKATGSVGIFQWYLNGERITGAVQDTYTPTTDGTYSVSVTNSNNCSATSDNFEVTWMSVENANFDIISVTPNPNDGEFNFSFNSDLTGIASLKIYDLQGIEVYNSSVKISNGMNKLDINLHNATTGTYFIVLRINSNEITSKFIIK